MPLKTKPMDLGQPNYFNVASFLAALAYPDREDDERKFADQLRAECLRHVSLQVQGPVIIEVPLELFKIEAEPKFFSESLYLGSGQRSMWSIFEQVRRVLLYPQPSKLQKSLSLAQVGFRTIRFCILNHVTRPLRSMCANATASLMPW